MSTALSLFDTKTLQIPAHLQHLNEDGNIPDKVTVPSLSFEGKIWTISINGEKMPLMRRDAEGDEIPLSVMRVVVLGFAQRRGRSYYPGAYDPAKATQPTCWSDDGEKPHPSIREPQARTCAECPLAVKGSKISEQGKQVAACSQHRILVVVPANRLDLPPLRMKIPVTSDYDKESADAQWFAFQQYRDFLKTRGVNHSAMVVTKMKFDPSTAYPKILFSPERFLTAEEMVAVTPLAKSEEVTKLISGTWTPAGVNGQKIADDEDEAETDGIAVAAKAKADTDDEAEVAKAVKATKAAAKAEADGKAAATRANKAPVVVVDDDDEVVPPRQAPAKAAAPKAAAPKAAAPSVIVDADVPEDLQAILSDWED